MSESRAVEVNARIVYWGAAGVGKRTNLRVIHAKLRPDHRGELRELPTRLDPTVTYTMLPIELGEVSGVRTRIQVVAAPSGREQAPTRKQLLDRVDGIVFVADARREKLGDNLASFEELRAALAAYGRSPERVPLVIQYNKRDLSDPFALEELHRKLGLRGVAAFEAVAKDGNAVLQTLTTISKRVIRHRREETEREAAAAPAAAPATPRPSPPPGTTQFLARMTEPEPAAEPAALEPELLAAPELLDDVDDTAAAAEALFEPSFREATQHAAAEPDVALAPDRLLHVESLGTPSLAGPTSVRVPVRVRDAKGRTREVALRIHIDAIEDADA
jgi:signal recognition particle receptor subunit beta